MVILKEVEIKKCFSIDHALLEFKFNNYGTIFNVYSNQRNDLIYAVQSFFYDKTALCKVGCTPKCQHDLSCIRIKFMISEPKNSNVITVDAMRTFSKPNIIRYYFGDEQYMDSIEVFRERCQMNIIHHSISRKFPFNNLCTLYWNNNERFVETLAYYLSIPSRRQLLDHGRSAKYIQVSLLIADECELVKKRTFVDILNEIGNIFNCITYGEYIVKFTIPLLDKTINVQDMNWDYMDLSRIEVWCTKSGSNITCIYNELEPGLKEIMKISQTIALAKHLRRNCIVVENTIIFAKYQNQELIRETIGEAVCTHSELNSSKKNFLRRIIEICSSLKIMILINYIGKLPILPANTNVIQCITNSDNQLSIQIQ